MNVSALLDASSSVAQVFRMYRQERPGCSLPYADDAESSDSRAKFELSARDREPFLANAYAIKLLKYKHTTMPNTTVEGLIFYFRVQEEFSTLLKRTCMKYGHTTASEVYDDLKGPSLRLALEQAATDIADLLEKELAEGNTKQRIRDAQTTAADSNDGTDEHDDRNCCNRTIWLNGVAIQPSFYLHAAIVDLLGKTAPRVLPLHGSRFTTTKDSYTRNEVMYFLCLLPGVFARNSRRHVARRGVAGEGHNNPKYIHYKNLVFGKVEFTTISSPGRANNQTQKDSRKTVRYTFRLPFACGGVYVGHFTAFFKFVFPMDRVGGDDDEDDDDEDYERDRVSHELAEVEWLPRVEKEVIKYDLSKHVNSLGTTATRARCSNRAQRYVRSSIEYIYVPTSSEEEELPVADIPDRQNTVMKAINKAIRPCTYIKTKASESNLRRSVKDRPGDVYFVFSKASV